MSCISLDNNPNRFENLIASAENVLECKDLAVVVTDEHLKCCWANAETLRRMPTLALPDGIIDLFVKNDPSPIIDQLKGGIPFFRDLPTEPFNSIHSCFIPMIENDVLYACIIILGNGLSGDVQSGQPEAMSIITAFSNEYKLPLTIIFSTLGLMARRLESSEDETMLDYVRLITHNCYRMLRLSNNIAAIARYRSGVSALRRRNGDIFQFFSGLCSAAAVLTASIGIPLEAEIPQERLFVSFDPQKLSTVFLNLISNACKYTCEGNRIKVKAEAHGSQVVVAVTDKGAGINPELLQYIFKPYFTRDPEGGLYGGAGIGLSLVKCIVALHGGTVAVRSEPGTGTTVAFTIPVRVDSSLPDYVAENG
ncbi:MAG: HAMP domain-containing sensor histidine kinase, partial [Clostridia bacterium]|nr:HAMP domain-containing sensor histidine kinase [Clostridia bacterium]